jgi:nitrate/nitrite-specific signal transduction histidine kinase
MREKLESMSAALAVAMDHARLLARDTVLLHEMELAVREPAGLAGTLERILATIATVQHADTAAVFQTLPADQTPNLHAVATWHADGALNTLSSAASQALQTRTMVVTGSSAGDEQVIAVPLVVDGNSVGGLVLTGQISLSPLQTAMLDVVAGLMALTILNNQLYAAVESQIILQERSRLAREVHDGLAQSLGFLNFKVQHVDHLLDRGEWEAARQALQELHGGVHDIYTEVRFTLQDLRGLDVLGLGLDRQLQQYGIVFKNRTGLDVNVNVDEGLLLPPRSEVQLFRIVQEALMNVYRHARAHRVWVRLHAHLEGIRLEVEDDGVGITVLDEDSERAGHFGLRIIRERVESMGGRLAIESAPGNGVKLRVVVPFEQPHAMAKLEV